MSHLDAIEAWAAAQLHRADIDRAHIRKLVVVARAVRRWTDAKCDRIWERVPTMDEGGYGCEVLLPSGVGDPHHPDCEVAKAAADVVAADLALEIP